MRALKILFGSLALIMIALVMIVIFGLNSATFLDKSAKFAIEKSGLDISFSEIKGGLYSGLEIKDFNYQDDVKADLKVDIDFPALREGKVKVRDINLSNLHIDKDFLATLVSPSEKNTSADTSKNSFIKEISVDRLHLDTKDIVYDTYTLDALVLDVHNFHYDMKEDFSGDINAHIASNVALVDVTMKLKDSHYDAHIDADVQKDFIAPYIQDSNVSLRAMPHIMIEAVGDMDNAVVDAKIGEGVLKYDAIMIRPK